MTIKIINAYFIDSILCMAIMMSISMNGRSNTTLFEIFDTMGNIDDFKAILIP